MTECKTRERYARIGGKADNLSREGTDVLVDRYRSEDIFARVPQMTARIDPVLVELDRKCQNWEHEVQSDTFQPCQYSLLCS